MFPAYLFHSHADFVRRTGFFAHLRAIVRMHVTFVLLVERRVGCHLIKANKNRSHQIDFSPKRICHVDPKSLAVQAFANPVNHCWYHVWWKRLPGPLSTKRARNHALSIHKATYITFTTRLIGALVAADKFRHRLATNLTLASSRRRNLLGYDATNIRPYRIFKNRTSELICRDDHVGFHATGLCWD